jgi:hypothetical protein
MKRTITRSLIALATFAATFAAGFVFLGSDARQGAVVSSPAPGTPAPVVGGNPLLADLPVPSDLGPDEQDETTSEATPGDDSASEPDPGSLPDVITAPTTIPLAPAPSVPTARTPPGTAFPTTNPLRIDGAVDSYYTAANDLQASLYGLPPGSIRTWGMDLDPSDDPVADHARIVASLKASGFVIVNDEMVWDPDGTVGRITGDYKGWTFEFTVLNRRSASISLLNW